MTPLPEVYSKANELKVIVYNKNDFDWALEQAKKVNKICLLFLQPEWCKSDDMMPLFVDFVKEHSTPEDDNVRHGEFTFQDIGVVPVDGIDFDTFPVEGENPDDPDELGYAISLKRNGKELFGIVFVRDEFIESDEEGFSTILTMPDVAENFLRKIQEAEKDGRIIIK